MKRILKLKKGKYQQVNVHGGEYALHISEGVAEKQGLWLNESASSTFIYIGPDVTFRVMSSFFFFFFWGGGKKPYMSANLANDSNTQQTDKGNL